MSDAGQHFHAGESGRCLENRRKTFGVERLVIRPNEDQRRAVDARQILQRRTWRHRLIEAIRILIHLQSISPLRRTIEVKHGLVIQRRDVRTVEHGEPDVARACNLNPTTRPWPDRGRIESEIWREQDESIHMPQTRVGCVSGVT